VKINTITVTIDLRLHLGNYEGVSNPLTMQATLEEEDDPQECVARLYAEAKRLWAREMIKMLRFVRERKHDRVEFDQVSAKTLAELKKLALA
jgi:hypothetical protein